MATSKNVSASKAKMVTTRTIASKTASRESGKPTAKRPSRTTDAIAILRADHRLVNALFSDYESARTTPKKKKLVAMICAELNIHAQVEEEIFYPALKAALRDKKLIPEATVEHATLKDLISQLEGQEPAGEMYDARVNVLSEYVKHHVKEEQDEIFPKAKTSKLDLNEIGVRILARKEELRPQMTAKAERPDIVASIKNAIGIDP